MDKNLLAEETIKNAINKGCDEAEVFIKTAKRLSVEVKNNRVEALETARDFGISLRIIKKQKLGFSFTTSLDGLGDMIDEAVNAAGWATADEYRELPDYGRAQDVLVFDEKIKDLKENKVIESALSLEKATFDFDTRIKKVRKAEIDLASAETLIFNSKGIDVSYESSYITAFVTPLASDGQDMQAGWDYATSRRLSDMDFVSVAKSASKRAIDLLGARKITSVKVPVILDPSVATGFLNIFSSSLSAEAVQKKRSFLAGKIGEKIISPVVNVLDDALMPWKIGTRPADDEGVPTTKKVIISNGTLTGFIHNTYTAKKESVVSTGNAVRRSFRNLPGIDVANFYIEPLKNEKDNNLLKSISKGLLILETMGIHTANPISGDFSIGISGLWIEAGEIAYPIKEAVMSGNILELFDRIEKVGNDLRFYGKIGSPSLLISEMDISA